MSFAGRVWRLLVGIKDALVLLFMLLFFLALFGVLTARPNPAQVSDGALLLEMSGLVVEERTEIDAVNALLSGQPPLPEFQARDLIRALNAAATDDRIKGVVLDLDGFIGGGQVHLQAIGDALSRVRAAEKPVMAFATVYSDDALLLAAHANEVWLEPMGGAFLTGPGGPRLYYGELLDKLNVNARVYKVGTYKAAVEPYTRNSMSDEARENANALYGALWEEWQAHVSKARPEIKIDRATKDPVSWINDAEGDFATAALEAGLIDTLGSKHDFDARVTELVGEGNGGEGDETFAATNFGAYLQDIGEDTSGEAIGVITVSGEIVDAVTGPGSASGPRISDILDKALEDDLAGLVIRVDSPGGSVLASEQIRRAVLRHKDAGIPIAVSMANVAASGGYWISTPADRIFAEPETITGSIGIFAVLPSFEKLGAEWGVSTDGAGATVLAGQPDLVGGFAPEVDAILQASIENGYEDFLTRVGEARKMDRAAVDRVGQGRVWDGGTARQIGLVDQYGGIDTALAWVAEQAELGEDGWHARYLGDDGTGYNTVLRELLYGSVRTTQLQVRGDVTAMVAAGQQRYLAQVNQDLNRLMSVKGMQAYCLECPPRFSANPAGANGEIAPQNLGQNIGWLGRMILAFN
jgi:protease-4